MDDKKKQVSMVITDIDDIRKVLISLNNLFVILINHYSQQKDLTSFHQFVKSIFIYFGTIVYMCGMDIKEFEKDDKHE